MKRATLEKEYTVRISDPDVVKGGNQLSVEVSAYPGRAGVLYVKYNWQRFDRHGRRVIDEDAAIPFALVDKFNAMLNTAITEAKRAARGR